MHDRILQGPDGVCFAQTARDIKLTIQTLKQISSTLEEIAPLLLKRLDLKALTALVVENLFAEVRKGNEMLLVLKFAHRFSSHFHDEMQLHIQHWSVFILYQTSWFLVI